jgi:hypothetical protein
MLSEAQFYRYQAQRCQERLSRVSDPRCRKFVEQERRDWSELAEHAAGQKTAAQFRSLGDA